MLLLLHWLLGCRLQGCSLLICRPLSCGPSCELPLGLQGDLLCPCCGLKGELLNCLGELLLCWLLGGQLMIGWLRREPPNRQPLSLLPLNLVYYRARGA